MRFCQVIGYYQCHIFSSYVLRLKQGRIENDRKKRTSRITSAAVLALVFIMGICIGTATTSLTSLSQSVSAQSFMQTGTNFVVEPKAPMAVSQDGNNVYIVWWTNKSENWEVMFRASNDGGQTFGDKIMLGVNGTISTATGNTTESTTTTPAEQEEEQLLPNEEIVPTEEET